MERYLRKLAIREMCIKTTVRFLCMPSNMAASGRQNKREWGYNEATAITHSDRNVKSEERLAIFLINMA